MDLRDQVLVVATAERYINIVNLDQPTTFWNTIQSPLKYQTRVVSCFADAQGYAVGSIEGRCAIQYLNAKDNNLNFSFKCHRQNDPNNRDLSRVYSVNAISFHPVHGTFSTAGSDGTFHFWDKDAKHRLKGYPEVGGTITSTDFNRTGNLFAYAVSYDWSKGYAQNSPQSVNKVMLHAVGPEECKPRPGTKKR
jgi:mRNA export factor